MSSTNFCAEFNNEVFPEYYFRFNALISKLITNCFGIAEPFT